MTARGAAADATDVVLRGRLWRGADDDPAGAGDGCVVIDAAGVVTAAGPVADVDVPDDRPQLGGPDAWIVPGVRDAHVHLAFGDPRDVLAGGVVAVRDLGAPLHRCAGWRALGAPLVDVAGEIVTAPGGYPSRGWGADGFARFVDGEAAAGDAVDALVAGGAAVVKLAFEPHGGPVLTPAAAAAVVARAHAHGRPAVAHALTAEMVHRALDAGCDELVHLPTERLPAELVDRLAAGPVTVTSTLWTFHAEGAGAAALANAEALLAAGVPLRYGTDLGNTGTRPGVEPEELRLLAAAGLGPAGALRLATAGWPGREAAPITAGAPAALVLLPADPVADPTGWRRPLAVVAGGRRAPGMAPT